MPKGTLQNMWDFIEKKQQLSKQLIYMIDQIRIVYIIRRCTVQHITAFCITQERDLTVLWNIICCNDC